MSLLLSSNCNTQPRHGIAKVVPSFSQAHPDMIAAVVDFKKTYMPSAGLEIYESSIRIYSKNVTITLRRSVDNMELVVDRRLKSNGWKSAVFSGKTNILSALESLSNPNSKASA